MQKIRDYKLNPPEIDKNDIFAECAECGEFIEYGEVMYEIDMEYVHEDCVIDYLRDKRRTPEKDEDRKW